VMDHTQLELFADRSPTPWPSNLGALRRLVPENLSDAALIAALPDALLADACALAAEAGRRRLGDAVSALVALCNRFVGFGVDCNRRRMRFRGNGTRGGARSLETLLDRKAVAASD
jgi:hypothetical protein